MKISIHPLVPFSEFLILILIAFTIVGVLLVSIGIQQLWSGKRFGLVYLIVGLVILYPVVTSFIKESGTRNMIELKKRR